MPKQIQLNIAEPCHEDWGKMTPDEKGRFCGSCQKQVVDFSNMSDRQVAEFFKKPSTGSVCGRFMTDQLDRSIEIPKKRIPWLKYFFQVAIPAFLVTLKASAVRAPAYKQEQTDTKDTTRKPVYEELRTMGMIAMPVQKPIAKKDTLVNPVKKPELNVKGEIDVKILDVDTSFCSIPMMGAVAIGEPVQSKADKKFARGRVIDQEGRPVAFASIQAANEKTVLVADEEGGFQIKRNWLKKGNRITVSSAGYETLVTSGNPDITGEWVISLKAIEMLPELVLQTTGYARMGKVLMGSVLKIKKEELTGRNVAGTGTNERDVPSHLQQLIVYPNPVITGTAIMLSSKSLVNGLHQLEFISLSGQRILQREIRIDPDAGTWKLDIPQVSAGSYFIVLTNKQNGSKYSARLIVQSK